MPMPAEGKWTPQNRLRSMTRKTFAGDTLETRGSLEVQDVLPRDQTHVRVGILIKARQSIAQYRYPANGYDVLRHARDRTVEADLNRSLPQPGHVWRGFRIPIDKIPLTGDGKLDVQFKLRPFRPGSAQDVRIVYQMGSEQSFANEHYNYGVSTLSRPALKRPTARKAGAMKKAAGKTGAKRTSRKARRR